MSFTYRVPDAVDMALAYYDPDEWFVADQIFVRQPKPSKKGSYYVDASTMWYQRYDFRLGKDGYPLNVDVSDSEVTWDCQVRGRSYPIDVSDLEDYKSHGFNSAEEYRQHGWEYIIHMAMINKEIAAVTAIADTTNNYDAANVHTIGAGDFAGSSAWSDATNGTPITDVNFLKYENPFATHIAFSWLTMKDLMNNSQILDFGSVTAADRDQMSARVTQQYLSMCFGLEVIVSRAQAVTAATADLPVASQTKGALWGDYVWVGLVNPQATGSRVQRPTWGHEYVFAPVTDPSGWIMKETYDELKGMTGELKLSAGYFNQYKPYAKSYGQLLSGVN